MHQRGGAGGMGVLLPKAWLQDCCKVCMRGGVYGLRRSCCGAGCLWTSELKGRKVIDMVGLLLLLLLTSGCLYSC